MTASRPAEAAGVSGIQAGPLGSTWDLPQQGSWQPAWAWNELVLAVFALRAQQAWTLPLVQQAIGSLRAASRGATGVRNRDSTSAQPASRRRQAAHGAFRLLTANRVARLVCFRVSRVPGERSAFVFKLFSGPGAAFFRGLAGVTNIYFAGVRNVPARGPRPAVRRGRTPARPRVCCCVFDWQRAGAPHSRGRRSAKKKGRDPGSKSVVPASIPGYQVSPNGLRCATKMLRWGGSRIVAHGKGCPSRHRRRGSLEAGCSVRRVSASNPVPQVDQTNLGGCPRSTTAPPWAKGSWFPWQSLAKLRD